VTDSTVSDFKQAIIAAINEDPDDELRSLLMSIPERIEKTVKDFTPVGGAKDPHPGRTLESIEIKSRRGEYKRLSTRPVKIGEVFSDDDPERVMAIEFGRHEGDKYGATPEFAMFRKSAAAWNQVEL
jgi:hypothetical protein